MKPSSLLHVLAATASAASVDLARSETTEEITDDKRSIESRALKTCYTRSCLSVITAYWGPGDIYSLVGTFKAGRSFNVECKCRGPVFGGSDTWDKLTGNMGLGDYAFVPAADTSTGCEDGLGWCASNLC